MPVSDDAAFELLHAFGRLECQLKRRHDFLRADGYGNAMVNWKAVNIRVAALQPGDFIDRLSETTTRKVLAGAHDRPKVQKVEEENRVPKAVFRSQPLRRPDSEPSDAAVLIEAARRVRNNLFHWR